MTLVELVVALGIASALVLLALPEYRAWMARQQRMDLAQRLAASMALARSEAVKHGSRVNVCKSADGRVCRTSGGWESGWLVYYDDDRDGELGADEHVVRREVPPPRSIAVEANRPLAEYVSFTPLGHARMLNGALQMGTFTVCQSGARALHVVLANTGRVRIDEGPESCP